jgi:hypothetical protein
MFYVVRLSDGLRCMMFRHSGNIKVTASKISVAALLVSLVGGI